MGNTLETCSHMLNDLYPHIFSFLYPPDLIAVSLTSKQFFDLVNDEVWKELVRRDFGTQLESYRKLRRDTPPPEPDVRPPTSPDDEEEDESGSLFRKVLLTGWKLKLGTAAAPRDAAVHTRLSYKELYRLWAKRVLLIYNVYSRDNSELNVEPILREAGIEVTSLVRTNSQFEAGSSRTQESQTLVKQLAEALPQYNVVLYMSNGAVSSDFLTVIGDALADFVERGGAVIIFPFATATERLKGRWDELGCNPMLSEAQTSTTKSLHQFDPTHPLFEGIGQIQASYRGTGDVSKSAKALAYYDDGSLFAGEMTVGRGFVLAVNLFPPPVPGPGQRGGDGGWHATPGNDVPRLLANAVHYARAVSSRMRRR